MGGGWIGVVGSEMVIFVGDGGMNGVMDGLKKAVDLGGMNIGVFLFGNESEDVGVDEFFEFESLVDYRVDTDVVVGGIDVVAEVVVVVIVVEVVFVVF